METKNNPKNDQLPSKTPTVQPESTHLTVVKLESNPATISDRLAKIASLEKSKSYLNRLNERIQELQDFSFEDSNKTQIMELIDSQGKKFETNYAPLLREVVDVLLAKARFEKAQVEEVILSATL